MPKTTSKYRQYSRGSTLEQRVVEFIFRLTWELCRTLIKGIGFCVIRMYQYAKNRYQRRKHRVPSEIQKLWMDLTPVIMASGTVNLRLLEIAVKISILHIIRQSRRHTATFAEKLLIQ